jgi:serine protease DegQ
MRGFRGGRSLSWWKPAPAGFIHREIDMAEASLIAQVSEQLGLLADRAAASVVQVGGRHGRPATGTVFAPERILAAANSVVNEGGVEVRDASGEARPAEYAGADPATGLAVLRAPGLTVPALAASERVRVGQLVLSLGRTWSGALAASAGIVAVVGGPLRTGRRRVIEQVVRADVRVHPLGAGGPLVDAEGRAVAIATGATLRGMPLFVPASIAWKIADSIAAHGSPRRGYLGISAQPVRLPDALRAGRPQEAGLIVVGTAAGSPAEQAGVLLGDVLVAFDGRPVEDHDALLSLLAGGRVGQATAMEIIRGGEVRTVTVTVGERP